MKAAGIDVVGFGAGEPDFPTPDAIVEAAIRACREPVNHRYTPTAGLPQLREAVAVKTARDSGYAITAGQVLVTNGGKHAIANAFATLLDPGDEVLVPAPYWTTYPESIALAGGVPVIVPTDESTGFQVSVEELERYRTERTKVLLFVSPSNPTGAVYPKDAIAELGRYAVDTGLWVLTDEIYEHLVYEGAEQHSMPVLVPELADRCIVVNGVAKTYAMTGWRVGWMIGPTDVVDAATNLQSHETSNVDNVAQCAALAGGVGRPRRGGDDARGLRPAAADDLRDALGDPRRVVLPAGGRVLRVPVIRRCARQGTAWQTADDDARTCGARARGGKGCLRAGRGVRNAWLRPLFLCACRRRHGGGCAPHRGAVFRGRGLTGRDAPSERSSSA